MRRLLTIGAIAVTGACTERVSFDLSGPNVDPNAFVGTWSLNLGLIPGCGQPFRLQFSIDADDAALANDESMSFVSQWWLPDSPSTTGAASGNINWSERTFAVVFRRSDRQARFEGTNPTATRLNGKLSDVDVFLGPSVPPCLPANPQAFATK